MSVRYHWQLLFFHFLDYPLSEVNNRQLKGSRTRIGHSENEIGTQSEIFENEIKPGVFDNEIKPGVLQFSV